MFKYDSGSDSELDRAIALSLQDVKKGPLIDLLSDEEDELVPIPGLNRPESVGISHHNGMVGASSRQPLNGNSDAHLSGHAKADMADFDSAAARDSGSLPATIPEPIRVQYGLFGVGGADRKRMEEERLARARKRKATSISPPPISRQAGAGGGRGTDLHSSKKGTTSQKSISTLSDSPEEKSLWQDTRSKDQAAVFMVPRSLANSNPMTFRDIGSDSQTDSHRASFQLEKGHKTRMPEVLSYKQQLDLLSPGIHFPDGAVRKTWVHGSPRHQDIKIEEVLQKDDLEMAVLSACQWDEEWILRKINMVKTKVICVVQAETEQQKAQILANVSSNLRFCFPSMAGQIVCMHSKLQMLSHLTHLRVVVPSANLVPYDWGESDGTLENVVFMIDLPRLPNMQKTTMDEITPFGRELLRFLGAMGLDEGVKNSALNFDFSRTHHLAFIHSIGGSHLGADWKHTGYCGLGSAIQELGLETKHAIEIDIVAASIGNLTEDFLKSIYLAAQGDDGTTELNWRIRKPSQGKASSKQSSVEATDREVLVSDGIENTLRVYFPSHETVLSSKGGAGAGGTVCCQSRWFDSPTFPRSVMRDCKSQRPGLLMHNKMLFVRPRQPLRGLGSDGTKECVAWAYVGSANLSESAWGRLVRDKTTKQPKLNIRNWECGVVVPVITHKQVTDAAAKGKGKEARKASGEAEVRPPGMDVFDGIIPVPMIIPGEEYGRKRPWFYSEQ